MNIHIGEKIKERASELRIGSTELATLLGTSKQNIYGIFKRDSIDTGLLYKISKILKFDFFTYYNNAKLSPHQNTKAYPEEVNALKDEVNELKEKYTILSKLYQKTEENSALIKQLGKKKIK